MPVPNRPQPFALRKRTTPYEAPTDFDRTFAAIKGAVETFHDEKALAETIDWFDPDPVPIPARPRMPAKPPRGPQPRPRPEPEPEPRPSSFTADQDESIRQAMHRGEPTLAALAEEWDRPLGSVYYRSKVLRDREPF